MACFTKNQQHNGTNCQFEKYVTTSNYFVLNSLDEGHLNSVCTHYVCDKSENARVCVRNDSETHSTGVTGLHSRLRRSCNPVTQSRAFHCHFAHTRAFSLHTFSAWKPACLTHPPSAAYMRQWTGSALVQVVACRLFGATPLPEPMPPYCQLDPQEQISVKFESQFKQFHSRKRVWKCHLGNGDHFVRGKMS